MSEVPLYSITPKPDTQVTDLKNEDGQDICAAVSVLNPKL